MGAELWHHVAGPHESPVDALSEIQAQLLSQIDLASLLNQQLESVCEAVAATEQDDEYGLLDHYRSELQKLRTISDNGIPDDADGKLQVLRSMHSDTGQGIGNILDVTDVTGNSQFGTAYLINDDEVMELIGAKRPTMEESNGAIDKINQELGRGESICYAVYDADRLTIVGWSFVGNTVD